MPQFEAKRISHEFVQINDAPPSRVFPLLCPVRESEWVPGWSFRLVFSKSGIAEEGCIFITPEEDGSETTWVVTEYDPASFRVGFVWVNPGMVAARIVIQVTAKGSDRSNVSLRYTYTGLSPAGSQKVETYDEAFFRHKMDAWQAAINHFLRTGTMISGHGWE